MEITFDAEESDMVQAALRSYCSDLRMEIVDTDNPEFRRKLRHERELLEGVLRKLDDTLVSGDSNPADLTVTVRYVGVWTR